MKQKGLTLIELLVTVAVVGVLAGLTVVVLNPVQFFRRGRDGVRLTDLSTIQTALELYYADNGGYPASGFGHIDNGNGWATNWDSGASCYTKDLEDVLEEGGYLRKTPHDPLTGGCWGGISGHGGYMYYHSGTGIYCLFAHLEDPSDSADDDCPACPLWEYATTNQGMNYCVRNPY